MKKLLLTSIILFNFYFISVAQSGWLDSTFDSDGIVITDFDSTSTDLCYASVIQPDNKIVSVGHGLGNIALVRFNSNGNIDSTFGINGKCITNTFYGVAYACALQQDGNILAGGYNPLDSSICIVRVDSSGLTDTTFASNGIFTTRFLNQNFRVRSLIIEPTQKILVGCSKDNPSSVPIGFFVFRLNNDGSLDSSFGNNGMRIIDFGTAPVQSLEAMLMQPDGKFLIAGNYNFQYAIARIDSSGTLDTTFGFGGYSLIGNGLTWEWAESIGLQSTGKIIIGGAGESTTNLYFGYTFLRLYPNGNLDSSFATDGILDVSVYDSMPNLLTSIAIQNDKIIGAGYSSPFISSPVGGDFGVVRVTADGMPDTTFGIGGVVITDLGSFYDEARSVLLQPDGKILVSGTYDGQYGPVNSNFALIRYLNDLNMGVINLSKENNSVLIYPNPINQSATLEYILEKNQRLSLNLYDLNGQLVKEFFSNQNRNIGRHKEVLNFHSSISSGSYILVLSKDENKMSIRIMIQ